MGSFGSSVQRKQEFSVPGGRGVGDEVRGGTAGVDPEPEPRLAASKLPTPDPLAPDPFNGPPPELELVGRRRTGSAATFMDD